MKENYFRATVSEDIFSERSYDYFIQFTFQDPQTIEVAEEIISELGLWDVVEEIVPNTNSDMNQKFAIKYKGIHARSEYDKMVMEHLKFIYEFEGEYLGESAMGEDIVKPIKIIKKVKSKK